MISWENNFNESFYVKIETGIIKNGVVGENRFFIIETSKHCGRGKFSPESNSKRGRKIAFFPGLGLLFFSRGNLSRRKDSSYFYKHEESLSWYACEFDLKEDKSLFFKRFMMREREFSYNGSKNSKDNKGWKKMMGILFSSKGRWTSLDPTNKKIGYKKDRAIVSSMLEIVADCQSAVKMIESPLTFCYSQGKHRITSLNSGNKISDEVMLGFQVLIYARNSIMKIWSKLNENCLEITSARDELFSYPARKRIQSFRDVTYGSQAPFSKMSVYDFLRPIILPIAKNFSWDLFHKKTATKVFMKFRDSLSKIESLMGPYFMADPMLKKFWDLFVGEKAETFVKVILFSVASMEASSWRVVVVYENRGEIPSTFSFKKIREEIKKFDAVALVSELIKHSSWIQPPLEDFKKKIRSVFDGILAEKISGYIEEQEFAISDIKEDLDNDQNDSLIIDHLKILGVNYNLKNIFDNLRNIMKNFPDREVGKNLVENE